LNIKLFIALLSLAAIFFVVVWNAHYSVTAISGPSSGIIFQFNCLPSFSTKIACVVTAEGLVEGIEVFQDLIFLDLVLLEDICELF